MAAGESVKNHSVFPVGTRVRPATKVDTGTRGTVEGHTRGWAGEMMSVRWDGNIAPWSFAPFEVKRAE